MVYLAQCYQQRPREWAERGPWLTSLTSLILRKHLWYSFMCIYLPKWTIQISLTFLNALWFVYKGNDNTKSTSVPTARCQLSHMHAMPNEWLGDTQKNWSTPSTTDHLKYNLNLDFSFQNKGTTSWYSPFHSTLLIPHSPIKKGFSWLTICELSFFLLAPQPPP